MKKEYINFTVYQKNKNSGVWWCECYSTIKGLEHITTKGSGYGYDKESTALANAINKFKKYFIRYTYGKKKEKVGLYSDNSISYGLGINYVVECLKCFKNVKILKEYYGMLETYIGIEIYIVD